MLWPFLLRLWSLSHLPGFSQYFTFTPCGITPGGSTFNLDPFSDSSFSQASIHFFIVRHLQSWRISPPHFSLFPARRDMAFPPCAFLSPPTRWSNPVPPYQRRQPSFFHTPFLSSFRIALLFVSGRLLPPPTSKFSPVKSRCCYCLFLFYRSVILPVLLLPFSIS